MATKAIEKLYVTMKRSFAGTPSTMIETMKSLGLGHRHQTVEKPNTPEVRGALHKIRHLVIIETGPMYRGRLSREKEATAFREPITVKHSSLPQGGNYKPLDEAKI